MAKPYDKPNVFFSKDAIRNFPVIVEKRKVYISREVLAMFSPVFKTMFYGSFKESKCESVKLSESLDEFIIFLECLFANPTRKRITDKNVGVALKFADKYDVEDMKQRCIEYFDNRLGDIKPYTYQADIEILDILSIADKYRLQNIIEQCIPIVARYCTCAKIFSRRSDISSKVMMRIFEKKDANDERSGSDISSAIGI